MQSHCIFGSVLQRKRTFQSSFTFQLHFQLCFKHFSPVSLNFIALQCWLPAGGRYLLVHWGRRLSSWEVRLWQPGSGNQVSSHYFCHHQNHPKNTSKSLFIIAVFLGGEMTCRLVILRLGKQSQLVITLTSNPIYVISIFIYVFNCISILISSGPRILPNQKDEGNMLLVSISEDASSA